jgi:hypothetical protein
MTADKSASTKPAAHGSNTPKSANEDADISDEEDEDYIPKTPSDDEDDDNLIDLEPDEQAVVSSSRLSVAKRKAVDEAFASLFGSSTSVVTDEGTRKEDINKKSAKKKKTSSMLRREKVLAELFGQQEAQRLIGTAKTTIRVTEQQAVSRKEPLASYLPRQPVTERKKFAGKEVEALLVPPPSTGYQRSLTVQQNKTVPNGNLSTTTTKKTSSLDAVLQEISGPTKISTVEKTASDWEIFKDKTDLKDDLETRAKGKDAYLEKKDFLQRVDLRQFDREKSLRDLQRSSKDR